MYGMNISLGLTLLGMDGYYLMEQNHTIKKEKCPICHRVFNIHEYNDWIIYYHDDGKCSYKMQIKK